ncbi:MAG: ADP-ribosylglycohydrolase family protein [Mailhella sp.]|nr:ADP-ribosylglycohydrolase family protein [Mailhella sp.]
MLGAIIGDIAGSAFEAHPWKGSSASVPFFAEHARFTDDTVMTCAAASALMMSVRKGDPGSPADEELFKINMSAEMNRLGRLFPMAGYGGRFIRWLALPLSLKRPYRSYGNGSAMRVSPIGEWFGTAEETIRFAELSAAVTHDHPEGIKGAVAVALAIFLARTGESKTAIKNAVASLTGYDLGRSYSDIAQNYSFDVTCQGSVPEALIAFLESSSFEDAVQKAIALGGDADTQAAMAGSIAEAFYGIPDELRIDAFSYLPQPLAEICEKWEEAFRHSKNQR